MNNLSVVDRQKFYDLSRQTILEDSDDAKECRNYLLSRKISKKTALDFSLGYVPSRVDHFLKDRLILPIKYFNGDLAYLSTRKFRDATSNRGHWHESFDKNIFLFCHPSAYNIAYEKKYAIIVEGQFDCMALAQKGILNTFSILGSNFSKKQMVSLFSIFKNIILFFDNDDAGESSCKKSFDIFFREKMYKNGCSIRSWPKYSYKDPDDMVRKMSAEEFSKYFNDTVNKILGDIYDRRNKQASIFNF
jgi:DNA primase